MCLIIHNPQGKNIDLELIEAAGWLNPHGFGITYLDGDKETIKGLKLEAESLLNNGRPYVCHWRYATAGKVSKGNCHPFTVRNDKGLLFSNGTVESLAKGKLCDTKRVADLLSKTPKEFWRNLLRMTVTRFAYVSPKGDVERFGVWHERDGVFYSNLKAHEDVASWYLPTNKKLGDLWLDDFRDDLTDFGDHYQSFDGLPVAVYGTLKKGYGNNRLLDGTKFLGKGVTLDNLRMIDGGFPYAFSRPHIAGNPLVVEVYDGLTAEHERNLDALEGYPSHYTREIVEIELENGEVVLAWLYVAAHAPPKNAKFIAEWGK